MTYRMIFHVIDEATGDVVMPVQDIGFIRAETLEKLREATAGLAETIASHVFETLRERWTATGIVREREEAVRRMMEMGAVTQQQLREIQRNLYRQPPPETERRGMVTGSGGNGASAHHQQEPVVYSAYPPLRYERHVPDNNAGPAEARPYDPRVDGGVVASVYAADNPHDQPRDARGRFQGHMLEWGMTFLRPDAILASLPDDGSET